MKESSVVLCHLFWRLPTNDRRVSWFALMNDKCSIENEKKKTSAWPSQKVFQLYWKGSLLSVLISHLCLLKHSDGPRAAWINESFQSRKKTEKLFFLFVRFEVGSDGHALWALGWERSCCSSLIYVVWALVYFKGCALCWRASLRQ